MHPVPRRLEVVEQFALCMEGRLTGRRASVLEQIARPDELKKLVADVMVGPADVVDIEPAVGALVSKHKGSRRDARDGVGNVVVSEPEGPEKSCACHRSRRSWTRREWNYAHTELTL